MILLVKWFFLLISRLLLEFDYYQSSTINDENMYIYFFFFYRDEMRNTFNLLLISMIAFDSWYLLGSILENFRRNFGLGSQLHTILFPKFLYPAMSVAMSGSIFMTVAISLERYFAVHHPIGNKINTILSSVFLFMT